MDISNAECEVMNVLWDESPLAASQIIERLNQHKPWHEKTVKTLLNRLVKKGVLSFQKDSRRYIYSPLVARNQYQRKQSQSLISKLFGGRVSPLVASFAESDNLAKDDVEALKKLIEQWESKQ